MSENLQRSINILFKEPKWILEWKEGENAVRANGHDTFADALASAKNSNCINWLCRIDN